MNVDELRCARVGGKIPSAPLANLYGVDLRGADLRRANLYGANLYGANLYGANLYGANLYGAKGTYGLPDTPSGQGWIEVTPQGHVLHVGCWSGSVADLRAMIAPGSDIDWPEARGAEKDRRRPYLQLVADYADLVIADHPGDVEECARIKAEIAAEKAKTEVSA